MKLSLEWLSEFVDTAVSPEKYAEAMTLSGSKVETVEALGSEIQNVVLGRVLSVSPHPDADRLSVCQVEVGRAAPVQIVTGASNVTPDALVPVALDGARLPGGKEIRTGALRGVTSEGMLCSLSELSLTVNDFPYAREDGIFLVEEPGTPGQDIRTVLGLTGHVVEFEITNNRPDCLSVIGLARESAATFDKPLTLPHPAVTGGGGDIEALLSVSVEDAALCPRYTARMVRGVKIGPSPRWLRERLRAAGVRPISNIVDITNYVMLEYGQPMHAFDYACLEAGRIVVRCARPGETLETLDGRARALEPSMLLIADADRPIGVAGVMGGANSEITEETRDIVFESANFNGPSVRRTALTLGMRTDASSRFEKGLDPTSTIPAVDRACELVERLGAGTVCDGRIDICGADTAPRTLPLDPDRINALLGTRLSADEIVSYLTRLGFSVRGKEVTVPSWRADVEGTADLAEEAARLYGYNIIESAPLPGGALGLLTEKQRGERLTRALCRAAGYSEILTYSFVSPSWLDKLAFPASDARRRCVRIENPLGEDTGVMRTTALSSMLDALGRNEAGRNKQVAFFELAHTYRPAGDALPEERPILTLGAYGDRDFFALKGAVETILDGLRVRDLSFTRVCEPSYHPGRCAEVRAGGVTLGVLGEVHPAVAEAFGLSQRTVAAELDFLTVLSARTHAETFAPLPRFPAVSRDLAVVCAAETPAAELAAVIRESVGGLLADCRVFDVYTGSQIPAGQKSVAFALTLRAGDRTLTDEEADALLRRALDALQAAFGVSLRA
ncbi:MAG: phenylalanine--tRNA ligase subunit beta [Oscillospiraceae bacterium]|jgi:phenylalanyl-tRNA synthetase beta chain|nr:phenylalanine--tRNA ligase subunit beta [Oscillospiraceae bacterium]